MTESRKRAILHNASIDLASIAAGEEGEATEAVNGVKTGDVVVVSAPDLEAGLVASAYASDVNEITLRVSNVSAGAVDAADQVYYFAVIG